MTDKEMLEKVIEKARENGAICGIYWDDYGMKIKDLASVFIFSHEFAKAFWGENYYVCHNNTSIPVTFQDLYGSLSEKPKDLGLLLPVWQYHLQQMVLEEEPLKYLERFLDE